MGLTHLNIFKLTICIKANSQYRLFICDSHNLHINKSFIAHCLLNKILLFILPPYISHLLQLLDIAIFDLLKKRLTAAFEHLNAVQLVQIQKYK